MPKPFGLSKAERLKSRKQIETLFEKGKSFTVFPVRVSYSFELNREKAGAQIGVSASKRVFKKAVDRNRIKRLLREAYRLQKSNLAASLKQKEIRAIIFFIYIDKTIATFETIQAAMHQCLKKLQQKSASIHENPA